MAANDLLRGAAARRLLGVFFLLLTMVLTGCGDDDPPGSTTATGTAVGGGGTGGTGTGTGTASGGSGGGVSTHGGPVDIQNVYNARHTGGLPTSDGRHVRDFVLIRSGHLADLDATGCDQLTGLGIQTVVDLRQADGSTGANQNPDASCVTTGTSYHQADIIKLVPPSVDNYLQTLTAAEPKLAAIFGHIGHDQGLPTILHCVIGRDRASIMTALVLLALGVSGEYVVQDYVENQHPDVQTSLQAEYMQAIVDHVTAQGGIDAYLQQHGVTSAQITALEALALE